MGIYCEGRYCKMKDTCALHNPEDGSHEYIDFSSYGSGHITQDDVSVEVWCGDDGNYKRYQPIENKDTVDTSKQLSARIQLKQPPDPSHDTYSLIQCANCHSHGIEITMDENDYLKLQCSWCGVTSRIKLNDDSSILKYKNMWNELKTSINSKLEYHESGEMQSISESIQGVVNCTEILKNITSIEEKYYTSEEKK